MFDVMIRELILAMVAYNEKTLGLAPMPEALVKIKKYLRELPWFYGTLFYLALCLFYFAIPPVAFKLRPFFFLTRNEKLKYLQSWHDSHWYWKRILLKLLSSICMANLFSDQKILQDLGFGRSLEHRRGET